MLIRAHIIAAMDTVLEARLRAASAEMTKPGRWRVALRELEQAASQLLASPEADVQGLQLTLDTLMGLYQWANVMQSHELRTLNQTRLKLANALSEK